MDLVHGEDYFKFGDKVTYWWCYQSNYRTYEHLVVIGHGEGMQGGCLRCANKDGGVELIHPRMLDLGWINIPATTKETYSVGTAPRPEVVEGD